MAGAERRKRFLDALAAHPMIEDVDWTRDGYQTAVLHLTDSDRDEPDELVECPNCGAVGLEEQIREHDCADFQRTPGDQA